MKKLNRLHLIIAVFPIIITAIIYHFIPETIPIHYNIKGEVDGMGPKWMLFIGAMFPVAILLLMSLLKKIDPKHKNYQQFERTYDFIQLIIAGYLILVQMFIILGSLNIIKNINKSYMITLGIMLILLGNYLPKVKHNYFVGVRTPWTIASEKTWNKTHRIAGYSMFLIGVISLISAFVFREEYTLIIPITLLISTVLFLTVYSYIHFKKTEG